MSVAKSIVQVEQNKLDWLKLIDEEGVVYRYAIRGKAAASSIIHVRGDYAGGFSVQS